MPDQLLQKPSGIVVLSSTHPVTRSYTRFYIVIICLVLYTRHFDIIIIIIIIIPFFSSTTYCKYIIILRCIDLPIVFWSRIVIIIY